jgi:5S rRNA maturation endonuclease (ribonuclease M5)
MYKKSKEVVTETYYYEDSIGDILFEKQRLEPEDQLNQGIKRFLYRRKVNGKWIWKEVIKTLPKAVKVPLYKLPNIFKADTVLIVEGEKCVNELLKHLPEGTTATTNHDGAGKWQDHYNTWLSGKTVYILQDNDEAGEKHTKLLVENLSTCAKALYLVTFKEFDGTIHRSKYDCADFIKDYGFEALEGHMHDTAKVVACERKLPKVERDIIKAEEKAEKEKDREEKKSKTPKIPEAKYEDFVTLFKRHLSPVGRDIFTEKILTKQKGLWQPAIDYVPILRSKAKIEEEAGYLKYQRTMFEDHFFNWAETMEPRFLVDVPQWDGVDRIKIFTDAFILSEGYPLDNDDCDQLVSDWLCKAWQRLEAPWTRNRILILKGPQEIGKDTWINSFTGGAGQFSSPLTTLSNDKDAYLQLSKSMFLKIGEFDKTGRTEVSMLKEMVTAETTDLRASYGRDSKIRECRVSFVSGCNVDDILRDTTGSTRYIILELDNFKRKEDGWTFDFPVRSEQDGLQILAQARQLAEHNFRASKQTEAKLKSYLDNKTPDDPSLDIADSYRRKFEEFLVTLDLMKQLEVRERGYVENYVAHPLIKEIAQELDLKERQVQIKLKALGFGIKTKKYRGYKVPLDVTPSDAVSDSDIPF